MIQFRHTCVLNYQKMAKKGGCACRRSTEISTREAVRAVPHGMRRTCVSRPKAGDKERPACGSRGLTDIRPCPARARAAARRRQKRRRRLVTLGLACLTLAIVLLAVLRQTSAAQPAGTEGGAAGQSAALPTAAAPHEGPPYTIAIDAGHGGTDIGAEGVINEIQLTEATIGYLEGWLTQDENYTPVRTHAADTFSKNTERAAAANSAGASLLLSVHGNSDPYSSDSYGLECYPQPPGRTHHEDSLRLAHLIADKFGAAGQRLRGNAGVRYIYYAGDDESGYEKQVVEESDSTVYSEQTFGLLEKTDCPAVLVEQCFVTSEADVAAWGTDDGCRRAARLYYEAICEYFGTEPLPGT